MQIAIIGCGLIGQKRAACLESDDPLLWACDPHEPAAKALAEKHHGAVTSDWKKVLQDPQVELVVVATPHCFLAEITHEALKQRKHVLVEKPAARFASELKPILDDLHSIPLAERPIIKVGFNHRFHPAMLQSKEIIESGILGPLMFIRGRYGHGGRLGYDREWRAQPAISGGGELLDQGMHLIDLSRWYLGDFSHSKGITKTYFWQMPVDDNAFLLLETDRGQVAQLHVSWTEWKNLFSLEIYGKFGKLHIEGLGKSYGTERLTFYQMKPEMGPPETVVYEYPGEDQSWNKEWSHLKESIRLKQQPLGNLEDAYAALKIVQAVYDQQPLSTGKPL